jgi:DNA-binding Lrp family transcriptional regulator
MKTTAFVLLDVKPGEDERVLEDVKKLPGVKEAHRVYGIYDIIIEIEIGDKEGLHKLVSKGLAEIPGVRSTLTMIVMD